LKLAGKWKFEEDGSKELTQLTVVRCMCLLSQRPISDQNSKIMKDCCNMNGPSVMQFYPVKAVDKWYCGSKTTRHMHGQKKPNQKREVNV
jgi:hypothetical protein